ncbi:hypothetical protein P9112_006553 [Eukaryota sp. TZLM1-RC]
MSKTPRGAKQEERQKPCVREISDWQMEPPEEEIREFRREPPQYSRTVNEEEVGDTVETERIYYEPVFKIKIQREPLEREVVIREPISGEEADTKREAYDLEEKELDTGTTRL